MPERVRARHRFGRASLAAARVAAADQPDELLDVAGALGNEDHVGPSAVPVEGTMEAVETQRDEFGHARLGGSVEAAASPRAGGEDAVEGARRPAAFG
jgi:hypothetical protein